MNLTLRNKKILNWILMVLFSITLLVTGIWNISNLNKVKYLTKENTEYREKIDSLEHYCKELGSLSSITVSCTISMKNTGLINQVNASQIAKEISSTTRQEILDSLYILKLKTPQK